MKQKRKELTYDLIKHKKKKVWQNNQNKNKKMNRKNSNNKQAHNENWKKK